LIDHLNIGAQGGQQTSTVAFVLISRGRAQSLVAGERSVPSERSSS
jgi:hypothetical protein